jgi:hypothetical protein
MPNAGLCATDEGLTHIDAVLAATPARLQASGLDARPSPVSEANDDPATLAARATAYQRKLAEDGQTISYAEARHCREGAPPVTRS